LDLLLIGKGFVIYPQHELHKLPIELFPRTCAKTFVTFKDTKHIRAILIGNSFSYFKESAWYKHLNDERDGIYKGFFSLKLIIKKIHFGVYVHLCLLK
jgi:hypothetical protein